MLLPLHLGRHLYVIFIAKRYTARYNESWVCFVNIVFLIPFQMHKINNTDSKKVLTRPNGFIKLL